MVSRSVGSAAPSLTVTKCVIIASFRGLLAACGWPGTSGASLLHPVRSDNPPSDENCKKLRRLSMGNLEKAYLLEHMNLLQDRYEAGCTALDTKCCSEIRPFSIQRQII